MSSRTALTIGAALVAAGGIAAALVAATGGFEEQRPTPAGSSIVVIDPHTNRISSVVPVEGEPGQIAITSGAVWVIDSAPEEGTLTHIDPRSRQVVRVISLPRAPIALAAGADAVWVLVGTDLLRIDPASNEIAARIPTGLAFATQGAVAVDGDVWVAAGQTGLPLLRVDPSRNRVHARIPFDGGFSIAVAGRSAWVLSASGSTVVRVDTRTNEVVDRIAVGVEPQPGTIATPTIAAGAGAVWVATPHHAFCHPGNPCEVSRPGTLTRIDPVTRKLETIGTGVDPSAVAVGEGAVWVANGGETAVTRIDPHTRAVVATMDVGGQPAGIAAGEGAVWVSVPLRLQA